MNYSVQLYFATEGTLRVVVSEQLDVVFLGELLHLGRNRAAGVHVDLRHARLHLVTTKLISRPNTDHSMFNAQSTFAQL